MRKREAKGREVERGGKLKRAGERESGAGVVIKYILSISSPIRKINNPNKGIIKGKGWRTRIKVLLP